MKVLLISPKDPKSPQNVRHLMGGESTYTKMLLEYPPPDINFIYFEDALREKLISYHWSYYLVLGLQKLRLLPPGPRAQVFQYHYSFDALYAHAYPIRIPSTIPTVLSDSSSTNVFLKQYIYVPYWKLAFWNLTKIVIFTLFRLSDGEVGTYKAQRLFVFSKWAKQIKEKEQQIKNCRVIYPGLFPPTKISRPTIKKIKLLFVGVWFERKGGRLLLSAYRQLRTKYKNISLTIFGELPSDITIESDEAIEHETYVSYRRLHRAYKSHSILVHIPADIEGYGMVVPEAMSFGLCCVVSNVCVLPEFIRHKKNGHVIVPNSSEALVKSLEYLITHPAQISRFGKAAQITFREKFSSKVFNHELSTLFREIVK